MNDIVKKAVQEAREKAEIEKIKFEKTHEAYEYEARRRHHLRDQLIASVLRIATKEEYEEWLIGYVKNGGKITHVYDYPISRMEFYIATKDFRLGDLCGALSLNVIVPKGIEFLGGETGHCKLCYMDGYRTNQNYWVSIYSDMFK